MVSNFRAATAVEILALRYCSPKGEGNPSTNAMLSELGLSSLTSGHITDATGNPGAASQLTTIRSKADAAEGEADDMIKWVMKNDPRIRDTRRKVKEGWELAGI